MFNENSTSKLNSMPSAFRIVSTSCVPAKNCKGVTYFVELYHEKKCVTVTFNKTHPDTRILVNRLVSVKWIQPLERINGAIKIAQMVELESPIKGVQIFETIPPRWARERALINRGKALFDLMPVRVQLIVTAILWDGRRFRRFFEQASSIRRWHEQSEQSSQTNVDIAKAILKDISKLVEFETLRN